MPVWLIITLVVLVIGLAASFLMKPAKPVAGTDQQLQVPTTEIGSPIGVLFGTRLIKSPNIVWYGDLSIVKVKIPTSGKKG